MRSLPKRGDLHTRKAETRKDKRLASVAKTRRPRRAARPRAADDESNSQDERDNSSDQPEEDEQTTRLKSNARIKANPRLKPNGRKKADRGDEDEGDTMSLNPQLWGPHAWNMLHGLPFLFPTLFYGERARQFLELCADLIPCGVCEGHFKKFLKDVPVQGAWATDAAQQAAWLNQAHNAVNRRNKKPEWSLSRHITKFQRMTVRQWATEMFTTLYYLLEYERLKHGQLFLFLQNLVTLLRDSGLENRRLPVDQRFVHNLADQLEAGLGSRETVVGCHVSCLQMHLHIIENDVMKRSSQLQNRLAALHI